MVALILVALAVAAPVVARDLRRDKEVESMHRAQQYVRAIRLYQRKFPNQYPASIEALEKSNNVRFLRKQYVDPLTGKADWRIIHVGENKTKVSVFFGEPLGGLNTSGGGSGLGSAAGLASGAQATAPVVATTSGTAGPVNALAAGFGGATSTAGGSTTPTSTPSTGGTQSSSGFGNGGAGPIMGVGSSRSGDSILNVNDQTTYETWEFLYDPLIELLYKKGQLGGGPSSTAASAFGSSATSDKTNTGGANPLGNGTGIPTTPTTTPR